MEAELRKPGEKVHPVEDHEGRMDFLPAEDHLFQAWRIRIENVIRQEKNPVTGKVELVESPQQSVRFSARGLPSDAEIADFHARTKDIGREDRKAA